MWKVNLVQFAHSAHTFRAYIYIFFKTGEQLVFNIRGTQVGALCNHITSRIHLPRLNFHIRFIRQIITDNMTKVSVIRNTHHRPSSTKFTRVNNTHNHRYQRFESNIMTTSVGLSKTHISGNFCKPFAEGIGVNITVFGRKLTIFFGPSRFPAFHLKCPVFFILISSRKNALYALCSASSGTQKTRQPASSARQS